MADLGVINQIDPQRGVRPPDRRAELQAQGQLLDAAGKVITEAIVGGVEDEISGDLKERVDILSQAQQEDMGPPADLASDEGLRLTARLDKLAAAKEMGTSSQKTLAEMQMKQTLAEAITKFPWLRENLLRRVGQLSQTSVELDRLGFYDAAQQVQGANAAQQQKQIYDHGTGAWDKGGLGIPVELAFGSKEWVDLYTQRQQLRQADTTRLMLLTNQEITSEALYDVAASSLQGAISGMRSAYEGIYQKNGFYAVLNAVQKGESGDPEILRVFKNSGWITLVQDMQQLNLNLASVYDPIVKKFAGTEKGEFLEKMYKDGLDQNNKAITLIQQMKDGVPNAAEQLDAMRAVRATNTYRAQPETTKAFTAYLADEGNASMIEIAGKDKSAAGLTFQHNVAKAATAALSNMNPTILGPDASTSERAAMGFITSGQEALDANMDPGQIINILEKQMRDADRPFYVPSGSDRNDQIGAATTIELHRELWNTTRSFDKQGSSKKAASFAMGTAYGLMGLSNQQNRPQDLDELTLANLAAPDTTELIEAMGDGEYANQRRAFGMEIKKYYTSTNPTGRRNASIEAYNTEKVGNTPVAALAQIDASTLSASGDLVYEVAPTALKREVDTRMEVMQGTYALDAMDKIPTSSPNRVRVEGDVLNEVAAIMDPIIRHARQDLDIHRNMRLAERPSMELNEGNLRQRYFDELGWLDGFRYVNKSRD